MVGIRFWILFVFLQLCSSSLSSFEQKIVFMTTPKGGSQMLRKAIAMIALKPFRKLPSPDEFQKKEPKFLDLDDPTIVYHHLEMGYEKIRFDTSGKFCKIVMIRDPRDVIVSMVEWIKVMGDTSLAKQFGELSLDEQITELIEHPNLKMNGTFPFVFDTKAVIQEALKWINDPSVFLCRFEDLVGPFGGGDREKQRQTILSLALHMGYELPPQRVDEIADQLFGETATFRKGQIGSWHDVFTSQHKELFKITMGNELVLLGYESNDHW